MLQSNPPRRHRRRARRRGGYRTYRLRHNPIGGGGMGIKDATRQIGPALIGAGGAVALQYVSNYLPASFNTGYTAYAVQFAGAIGLGVAAGAIAGKSTGIAVAAGGMTVVGFMLFQQLMSGTLGSGAGTMARFVPPGAAVRQQMRGLGYQGPARVIGIPTARGTAGFPIIRQNVGRFVPAGR